MDSRFSPMTLGDIFEKTATLVGRTFARNVLVAIIFLVIPAAVMTVAARNFYAGFLGAGAKAASFWGLIPFIGSTLLIELAVLLAEIAISYIVGKEMLSEPVSFLEALRDTFHKKWLSGLGQALLKYGAVFGGLGIIAGIFIALDGATKGASTAERGILMLFQVPFFVLLGPALFFLFYKWLFSLTAVAVEGLDSVDSLKKSWMLVDGFWWRTFGIFLLLTILAQFAISIISLPLKFGSMWTVYKDYYTMLGRSGTEVGTGALNHFPASIGTGVGIGTAISTVFSLVITPVFTVVMYFDLRARHYDFPNPDQIASSDDSLSPAA